MIKTIPLASILVPEGRQRQIFNPDEQGELIGSITAIGLISPIILRQGPQGLELVAGERRLRALNTLSVLGQRIKHAGVDLEPGHVPYIDFGELSELEQQEIEYAENAYRQDLTWQENVRATEKLDNLRKARSLVSGTPHSTADTAKQIFGEANAHTKDTVNKSLVLASHLSNPDVARATSLREAVKIVRRQDDIKRNEQLAALVGTESLGDRFKIYQADCLTWMKDQPDAQFDVILTDPPYGMGAHAFGDAAGRMSGIDHEYDDSAKSTNALLSACIPEWYRLAKPQAHLYLWCDIDMFTSLREMCRASGWWTFRTPLINLKPEGGRVPWPEHGPRRSYELCLYAVKGKRPVTSIRADYFESRLTEGNLGHGAQKPIEAYVELLRRSCRPGDIVLDTFAGTGTIFPAAHALGLSAVGVEMEAAAYGICLNRIGELK